MNVPPSEKPYVTIGKCLSQVLEMEMSRPKSSKTLHNLAGSKIPRYPHLFSSHSHDLPNSPKRAFHRWFRIHLLIDLLGLAIFLRSWIIPPPGHSAAPGTAHHSGIFDICCSTLSPQFLHRGLRPWMVFWGWRWCPKFIQLGIAESCL